MSIRRERESEQLINSWQQELVEIGQAWQSAKIGRREFLKRVTAVLALTSIVPISLQAKTEEKILTTEWREEPWWTLYEVQEHLFPHTDDSPGAKDIQATLYLKREIADPAIEREEADFVVAGVGWLNDMAQRTQSSKFVDLDYDKREAILRQIEQSSEGERWLSLIIYYIIEALLTDPIYGGNPDGSGWKWLSHHAGFPRPTADKVYSKL